MSKKQIFIVQACDAWGSKDSMRLLLVTTSTRRLRAFIAEKIRSGEFDYNDAEMSRAKQVKQFREDFERDRSTIDSRLMYGTYDYVYDGEEV